MAVHCIFAGIPHFSCSWLCVSSTVLLITLVVGPALLSASPKIGFEKFKVVECNFMISVKITSPHNKYLRF